MLYQRTKTTDTKNTKKQFFLIMAVLVLIDLILFINGESFA